MLEITNPLLDFEILNTVDPKKLIVADTSVWGFIENDPSIIEITPPMEDKPIVHFFNKNQINIFNSSNLYLSDMTTSADLPDGVYTITLKGSGPENCNMKTCLYLKTDVIDLKIANQYLQTDFLDNKKDNSIKDFLLDLRTLIVGAESAVKLGNPSEGLARLQKANQILDKKQSCAKQDLKCQQKL